MKRWGRRPTCPPAAWVSEWQPVVARVPGCRGAQCTVHGVQAVVTGPPLLACTGKHGVPQYPHAPKGTPCTPPHLRQVPPRLLPGSLHPTSAFHPPHLFFYFFFIICQGCASAGCTLPGAGPAGASPGKWLAARSLPAAGHGTEAAFPTQAAASPFAPRCTLAHATEQAQPKAQRCHRGSGHKPQGWAAQHRGHTGGTGVGTIRAPCIPSSGGDFVEAVVPGGTVTMPSLTPHGEALPDLPSFSFLACVRCRLDFTVLRQRRPSAQVLLSAPCRDRTRGFIASNPIPPAQVVPGWVSPAPRPRDSGKDMSLVVGTPAVAPSGTARGAVIPGSTSSGGACAGAPGGDMPTALHRQLWWPAPNIRRGQDPLPTAQCSIPYTSHPRRASGTSKTRRVPMQPLDSPCAPPCSPHTCVTTQSFEPWGRGWQHPPTPLHPPSPPDGSRQQAGNARNALPAGCPPPSPPANTWHLCVPPGWGSPPVAARAGIPSGPSPHPWGGCAAPLCVGYPSPTASRGGAQGSPPHSQPLPPELRVLAPLLSSQPPTSLRDHRPALCPTAQGLEP